MQPMKFKLVMGKTIVGRGRGYARAIRLLMDNSDKLLETGTAYIEREDGCVVVRVDLDITIPNNRAPRGAL